MKIYFLEISFKHVMIICKIGILNVQLVKSNLNFQHVKLLQLNFKSSIHKTQLTACKKQLATHNFTSIWQNKFATRIKELTNLKFVFFKLRIATCNTQLPTCKL